MLQATRDSLYQQYKGLDDDEDDAKDEQKKTVDSTRRQMQNNADTICLSAENNYISLASMQYSLAQTERSLQQLDRSIAQTKKQVALGIATKNTGGQPREHARYPVRLLDRHQNHHRVAARSDGGAARLHRL